jgi:hypothetical protein
MATASTFKIIASANDLPFLRNHDRDVFDDHGRPHFHARHASGSAKIRIDVI